MNLEGGYSDHFFYLSDAEIAVDSVQRYKVDFSTGSFRLG